MTYFSTAAQVVVELIYQFMDLKSLLTAARCCKYMLAAADSKIAFQYLPELNIIALKINTIPKLLINHPRLCFSGTNIEFQNATQGLYQYVKILHVICNDSNNNLSLILKLLNNNLTFMNLYGNDIRNIGAVAIAESLKNKCSLTYLNLSSNSIGDVGAIAISKVIKASQSLTSLELAGNNIGKTGLTALLEAIQLNHTLTNLNMCQNNINNGDVPAIIKTIKNSSLTKISLFYGNQISAKSLITIRNSIKLNKNKL